jgi:hypothetical protein
MAGISDAVLAIFSEIDAQAERPAAAMIGTISRRSRGARASSGREDAPSARNADPARSIIPNLRSPTPRSQGWARTVKLA